MRGLVQLLENKDENVHRYAVRGEKRERESERERGERETYKNRTQKDDPKRGHKKMA